MGRTNFQNLSELLKRYTPESFGIATAEECKMIKEGLEVGDMGITDLRNLRDFVVLFFSRQDSEKMDMVNLDRMSAIVAVIDGEIVRKGGEV